MYVCVPCVPGALEVQKTSDNPGSAMKGSCGQPNFSVGFVN